MADGKIIVNTQIDNKGAEKGIEELSKIIKDGLKGLNGDLEKVSSSILKAFGFDVKDIIGNFKLISDHAQGIPVIMDTVEKATEAFKLGADITSVVQSWQEAKVALALYEMSAEGATISQGVMNGVFTAWETLVALFTGKTTLAAVATGLWTKATAALNDAWKNNQIGIILAVLVLVVGAIIHLWNTNEGFRNAVIAAWNAILEAGNAVWSWLVNFFTIDIPNAWQSVVNFFVGIPAWFANLWLIIQQAFINGWNAIVNFFIVTVPAWIQQMFDWFNELPGKIGDALGFALGTIIKWGIDTFNYLVTNVPIWINNVVTWFSQLPGRIWTWLVNTITNIVNWGVQIYNNMVSAVTNAINAVINWFATLPSRIWTWLVNTISTVTQFGSNLASTASSAGTNMVANIIGAVKNLPSQFANIGISIVQGLWNGITGMGKWLADKVDDFFKGIVGGAKRALGIKSPSRVFRDQVGAMMAQGVGVGFEDEAKGIERSIDKRLSDMVSSFNVDEITARMTAAVYQEQAATSRAMTSSYDRITANNSTITNNNDNGLNFNIENFNNNRNQDIRALTEEIEFYRKQIEIGGGKA